MNPSASTGVLEPRNAHLMDHVQLRLLTSSCDCWRLPARSMVASKCSHKSSCVVLQQDRAEVRRATCLSAISSHRQALAHSADISPTFFYQWSIVCWVPSHQSGTGVDLKVKTKYIFDIENARGTYC